jgi:hypothetical protein
VPTVIYPRHAVHYKSLKSSNDTRYGPEPTQLSVDQTVMRHPELPFALAIAVILILVPLPSQIRRGNIAILTLMISTLLLTVILLVNTLVWAGSFRDVAPVWCDICESVSLCILDQRPVIESSC